MPAALSDAIAAGDFAGRIEIAGPKRAKQCHECQRTSAHWNLQSRICASIDP
jgi:hypothetical protein